MFTGIIERLGTVVATEVFADLDVSGGRTLTIRTDFDPSSLSIGESIATSGVCLTVTSFSGGTFTIDAGPETLERTTIGSLRVGSRVNLERSVTPLTRLGGHLVQGHVDAVGHVRAMTQRENARDVEIEVGHDLLRFAVPRGSITVDGISLTITGRTRETFSLSIIPHTWRVTTASDWAPGQAVNLEVDLIARYVAGLLESAQHPIASGDSP